MLNLNHKTCNYEFVLKLMNGLSKFEIKFLSEFINQHNDLSETQLDILLLNENPELFYKICNLYGGAL